MTSRAERFLISVSIVLALIACPLAAIDGVSPGEADRIVQAPGACPTFSWEMDGRAAVYELVVFAIADDERLAEMDKPYVKVLSKQLSGKATSWTPSAGECFAPGGRYVWFVRAVSGDGSATVTAQDWSSGRYFSTPAGPTLEEVHRALAVLDAWQRSQGAAPVAPSATTGATRTVAADPPPAVAESLAAPDVLAGIAAIRGEQSDATGETYGVVGIVASPDGAGVGAMNLDRGPDLVLDGRAASAASTELYEWGINRPDATDQTFVFRNSGAGDLSLEVDGPLTATFLRGDGSNLTNVTAATASDADMLDGRHASFFLDLGNMSSGVLDHKFFSAYDDLGNEAYLDDDDDRDLVTRSQGDRRFVNLAGDSMTGALTVDADGTSLVAMVTGSDELPGDIVKFEVRSTKGGTLYSVDSEGDVAGRTFAGSGAGLTNVTSDDLDCVGCVGAAEIAAGGVGTAEILDGQVTTGDLADGAVTGVKIATASVQGGHIASGAVDTEELRNAAVTSDKIEDGSVSAAKIAADAVGASEIATGAVRTAEILDGQVATADLAEGAVTSTKIAADAIGAAHIGDGEITADQIASFTVTEFKMGDQSVNARVIKDWSISSDDFASGAVTSWAIENGGIKHVDIDTSEVQRRVWQLCSSGSSIRMIGATGTVTCEDDDIGIGSIVAGTGLVGGGSASAVDLAVAVPLLLEAAISSSDQAVVKGRSTGTGNGIGIHGISSGGIGIKGEGKYNGGVFSASEGTGIAVHGPTVTGGMAARFHGNVLIKDPVTAEDVIELGKGLDYAEGFDVADGELLEPGSVLSIDPDNPGYLRLSRDAYDTSVVGIIAGANGLGSGIRLGAGGFDHDVALAGRVYCNVDASDGNIEPGDLLTTSALPGYAMKATDPSRARGAILGKAMEPLAAGETGQILVLVTLQ